MNDSSKKIGRRNTLERQAKHLAEGGRLDEAIETYWKSIELQNINQEHEKGVAIGAITQIYKWQKKYDKALETYEWFLKNSLTGKPTQSALDEIAEIEALKAYQEINDPSFVLKQISKIKEAHAWQLPPAKYTFGSPVYISDILRLYDTIGDLDGGIAYIDMILNWTYETDKEFQYLIRVKTAAEAKSLESKLRHERGDWRPYKWISEYLLVREAFEQDKAEGKKGRATRALIQSDYFPW